MGAYGGAESARLISTVPVMRTGNLVLRPVNRSDASAISKGLNMPEIASWMSGVQYPFSEQDAESYLSHVQSLDALVWTICLNRKIIGHIGIGEELGYWLMPEAWGKGFATQACLAVLSHFFHHGGAWTCAGVHPDNSASIRLLEKLGFAPVGFGSAHFAYRRATIDRAMYCLTAPRWQSLSAAAE